MTVAGSQSTDSAEDVAQEQRWRRIRRRVTVGYFALLAVFVWLVGVPADRQSLLLWIVAGLGIRCLGRGWRSFRQVLLDWLPFTAVLMAYDYTRGLADGLGIATHVIAPVHADEWLFGGTLPTVWLQEHLFHAGDPRWYDAVVTIVYMSHFLATPIIAVVLWVVNRDQWKAFITRVIALSFAGLATYTLYPMAPPWYAAESGLTDPILRLSSRGWLELGLNRAGNMLGDAQAGANPVAAMPSLHVGFAALVMMFMMRYVARWARPLWALYPVLMALVLIYSGEHYAIDGVFGVLYAALVMVGVGWWERRRDRRRAETAAPVAEEPAPAVASDAVAQPDPRAAMSGNSAEAYRGEPD